MRRQRSEETVDEGLPKDIRQTVLAEIAGYRYSEPEGNQGVKRFVKGDPRPVEQAPTPTPVRPLATVQAPTPVRTRRRRWLTTAQLGFLRRPFLALGQLSLRMGLVASGVALVAVAAFVVSFYQLRFDRSWPALGHLWPWPVAYVDGRLLPLDEFERDVATLRAFYARAQSGQPAAKVPSRSAVERAVIDRLVRQALVEGFASRNHLVISTQAAQGELASLGQDFGSRDELVRFLQASYQWSLDQFRDQVVVPYLLRQQVERWFKENQSAQQAARERASRVLADIRSGQVTFAEAAAINSEDAATAQQGGALGTFSWGTMVPEFESALRTLEPGQVSEPVKTSYGWHLIERQPLSLGTKNEADQVRASHILFKVFNFNRWLEEERAKARVVVFLRID